MRILVLSSVTLGVLIMILSILQYCKVLEYLRAESYSQKLFSRWIYSVGMLLMMFFLAGYILLDAVYWFSEEIRAYDILIASVFFFGAVFVQLVVQIQVEMFGTISKKTQELVKALVNAVEAKDSYTKGHSQHVFNLAKLLYCYLPPKMQNNVNISHLQDGAILHDIGKIGIPDGILNKPGPLNDEEWVYVREHGMKGKQIIRETSYAELGQIILSHHERVDGKGYYQLRDDQIPLEAKIIGVADTFSALTTDRVYRPGKTYETAAEILREISGTQLDAELVEIFLSIPEDKVTQTAEKWTEEEYDDLNFLGINNNCKKTDFLAANTSDK